MRLHGQAGFAVPTVMLAMIAAFGLATGAVIASVNSQKGVDRDQDSKAALAAAEAGISNALLRYNRVPITTNYCAPVGGSSSTSGQWCTSEVSGPVAGGSYSYFVRPTLAADGSSSIEVVSTGTADGVTRRVDVVATSSDGFQPFGEASVIGEDYIDIDSNSDVTADVATDGYIAMDANSDLTCGYAAVGSGYAGTPFVPDNGTHTCDPTADGVTLPPVNQGNVPTVNNNSRICTQDPYYVKDSLKTCPLSVWDPATRELSLTASKSSITLGSPGATFNYSLCRLYLDSNTNFYIAGGATVRIYFDSPEGCNYGAGNPKLTQLELKQNSAISPTGTEAIHLALLFVGSNNLRTKISLQSNTSIPLDEIACQNDFVVYAPLSDIEFASNSNYCGAMAGRTIHVNQNSQITASNTADEFELPNMVAQHYGDPDFVECSGTPATPPDAGC